MHMVLPDLDLSTGMQLAASTAKRSARHMDTALLVGCLASVCSVTSFAPQVWKVGLRHDARRVADHPDRFDLLRFSGYILIRKLRS